MRDRRDPPLRARTCDPSTEQSSRSSRSARRSSASRAACRRGQTPASVQSRSRRQAVTPEQPTVSAGTSRHATPVRSTYMTPASAARSGTRSRPGWRRRRSGAGGSSGATRSHKSPGTRSARTRTPCRPRSLNTRPTAQLILKRSVSHLPGPGPRRARPADHSCSLRAGPKACPSCQPAYGPLIMLGPRPGRPLAQPAPPTSCPRTVRGSTRRPPSGFRSQRDLHSVGKALSFYCVSREICTIERRINSLD